MSQVSIVTITQYSRFACLKNLYHLIQRQEYFQIKEWIIVEGSQHLDLHKENINRIQDFISEKEIQTDIEMRLIQNETGNIISLSNLRNLGNDNCLGDIIICMDDDDYYPSCYIPNIVEKFNKYDRLLAGCSAMYMYDYISNKLYKYKGYHNNHSTNSCMAYRREYLKDHRYNDGLLMAEEYGFTNGFTEPMIQIQPEKSVILSIHNSNTVSKVVENDYISEIVDKNISDMIPKEIFERMRSIFTSI